MPVQHSPVVDRAAFDKLRRIAPGRRGGVRPLPDELSFKLTNRCNLRCHHCYQWGDDGHHHELDRAVRDGELDLQVVADALEATREQASNVFLWGGEPLFYAHWDALAGLLAEHDRWTSVCTNGVYIPQRLESLERVGERLELFIALDGFEAEHDALRGPTSWRRTMRGLRLLLAERAAGRYLGEVTVNCVFQDAMIGRLHDFVAFLEAEGVDAVYLSYPWRIAPETAAAQDDYLEAHILEVAERVPRGAGSWHSYTFGIDPDRIPALRADLERVEAREWTTKVRYNPEVDEATLHEFLAGSATPANGRTACQSINSRLDFLPDAAAITCKFFPELAVGAGPLAEVWHGERLTRLRDTVETCGLMPVCSKCPMLYSRGR